jgi:hypothetical protein
MIPVLLRQMRPLAVLGGLVGLYALAAVLVGSDTRQAADPAKISAAFAHFAKLVPQMIFVVLFWRLLHLTYVDRAPDRLAALKAEVKGFLTDRDRIVGGVLAMAIMFVMLLAFAELKGQIPNLQPFVWDQYFADLDRSLHFGTLPHKFLLALFGGPLALSFFTGLYNIWLFVVYLSLVVVCFLRADNPLRLQYLIAFLLTWAVGGNLLATLFSSAGPVYYARLGLGDTYDALMLHLQAHAATGALTVIETQDLLWDWYTREPRINMISAFPSMHVASITLLTILAFRLHPKAGAAAALFTLGILIGSVLLAWHYAVDGYASLILAPLAWVVAGWIARLDAGARVRSQPG